MIGELFGVVLHPGLANGSRFDHPDDLGEKGVGGGAFSTDVELAFLHDAGGIDAAVTAFGIGHRFAGDGALIDHRGAADHAAVDGDQIAVIGNDYIADFNVTDGNGNALVTATHPGVASLVIEQADYRAT